MDSRAIARRMLLEKIYDKMSDDEKRTFVQLTMMNADATEIMEALRNQNAKINEVSRKIGKYPFASDLIANVAGNAITDGLAWFLSKLFKR